MNGKNPACRYGVERTSIAADGRRAEVSNSESRDAMERLERRVAIGTVIGPFIAIAMAIVHFWGQGVTALDLILCGVMYLITAFGVTMGFHRLFTHRSFKCGSALTACLGVAGSMAAQGPVLFWVACHRRHHQCSDEAGDPPSPHHYGRGVPGGFRGGGRAPM